MSGLEIFGMATTTAQVAQLSLNTVVALIRLFNSIRDAPVTIQARLVQVQSLVEILALIKKSVATPDVGDRHYSEDRVKEGEELRDLLEGFAVHTNGSRIKKWAHAIGGLVEEKIIGKLLRLEAGKSSLTLCIAQIDS